MNCHNFDDPGTVIGQAHREGGIALSGGCCTSDSESDGSDRGCRGDKNLYYFQLVEG